MEFLFKKNYTEATKPDVLMEADRIKRVYGDPQGLINSVKKNLGDMCVPPMIMLEDKGQKIVIKVTTPSNIGAVYCTEQLKKDAIASGWQLMGPPKRAAISNVVQVKPYAPTNSLFAIRGQPLPTIYEEEERAHNSSKVNLTQQPPANPVIKSRAPAPLLAFYTPEMAVAAARMSNANHTGQVTANLVKRFVRQTGTLPRTYGNLGFRGGRSKTQKQRYNRKRLTAKNRRHK
jgi:hypothetical protein